MEKLIIIGNGLDLYHKFETSYNDFRKFLTKQDYCLLCLIEMYFPKVSQEVGKWGDLEAALGQIDIDAVYNDAVEDKEIDDEHLYSSLEAIVDSVHFGLKELLEKLHKRFSEWINSIEILPIAEEEFLPYINNKALFLTFNYTETLESLYKIDSRNILYVHGKRKSGDKLILGHNRLKKYEKISMQTDPFNVQTNAKKEIVDLINKEYKHVDDIISRHEEFFASLSQIAKIVVYGHSLSDVDMPYFEKVASSVSPLASWEIYCHKEDDVYRAKRMVEQLKIKAYFIRIP